MKKTEVFILLSTLAIMPTAVQANPIPIPVPASMPLEEMTISIGEDKKVNFTGDFTFDFIPADVTKMQYLKSIYQVI